MTQELDKSFIGGGDVKGFVFTQISSNEKGYVYEVDNLCGVKHYEVIRRITSPICVDFYKREFSKTEEKEMYPKSNRFGLDAWTYREKIDALNKLRWMD